MTGHLTAQAAQEQTIDLARTAERHRYAHAELADRPDGLWGLFRSRRGQTAITATLATNEPCR
jgi:hypothetical protein